MMQLMEAEPERLRYRNAYNVTAMSVTPAEIAAAIRRHIPDFAVDYEIDPVRQAIADSWPRSLDDSAAHADWGFAPRYDLEAMTKDMLARLQDKLAARAAARRRTGLGRRSAMPTGRLTPLLEAKLDELGGSGRLKGAESVTLRGGAAGKPARARAFSSRAEATRRSCA